MIKNLYLLIGTLVMVGVANAEFQSCGVDFFFNSNLKKVSTDLQNTGKYYQCVQDNPTYPDGPEILCVYKMLNTGGKLAYVGLLDLRNYYRPHYSDAGIFDDNRVIFNSSEANSSFVLTSDNLSLARYGDEEISITVSAGYGGFDYIYAHRPRPGWRSPAKYTCLRVDPSLPKL